MAGKGWTEMTQAGKIAWLWNETNQFIEDFKKENEDRIITITSGQLFGDIQSVLNLLTFLEFPDLDEQKVKNTIEKRENRGKRKVSLNKEQEKEIELLTPLAKRYFFDA